MRLAFFTTELSPHTPGGAGTVVARLAELLAPDHDVTVLVVGTAVPESPGRRFSTISVPAGPSIVDRSQAAAMFLASGHDFDVVEFQDFDALGYETLIDRGASRTAGTGIVVRLHGPADLMFEAVGIVPPELAEIVARERECFRMADAVLVPSPSMAELAIDRYGLDRDRVVVASPPTAPIEGVHPRPGPVPEVVCYGRLAEVKGSHDFLRAMIPVLRARPEIVVRFIGEDGWSAEAGMPMRQWLEGSIPPELVDRVRFEGRLTGDRLRRALETAWLGVVPSRFEGYCLAADELRSAGLPIVARNLAGLRDRYSEATGALLTDGDLGQAVSRLLDDDGLRGRLAQAPAPVGRDPGSAYVRPFPPRHPRSQAGLATAAVQRVEAARPQPERRRGTAFARALARGAVRLMPRWAARLAVKIVPAGVKTRFRSVASWPEEEERRRSVARVQAVEALIGAGRFEPLESPDVTLVIPCYNQGAFVETALCSVFEQSHHSWEVVIVDDGSDDPATREILDAIDWPRVLVLRQENRGLPAARNTGIRAGRGRFVVPLDADDELEAGFLEQMLAVLEPRPEAAFSHCWARLFGDIDAVWVSRPFNRYQLLFENCVIGCVLLRKDAWEDVGGYDESMLSGNEDWELWIRLIAAGWDQVAVPQPLFRYRKHGISMSVATESRFEAGRDQIRNRHPELYSETAMADWRRRYHPCLSIIGGPGDGGGEIDGKPYEVVEGHHLEAGLRAASGRYVVDGREGVDLEALARAMDLLDGRPDLAGTSVGRVTLWRRWALLDPKAPLDRSDLPRDDLVSLGLDDWAALNPDEAGVPVQRQTPDWLTCAEAAR